MNLCTGCVRPVIYDLETKLNHCGSCIRFGERVTWAGKLPSSIPMTGTVTGFSDNEYGEPRVEVQWDHRPDIKTVNERMKNLRHINVLDQIVEAIDK